MAPNIGCQSVMARPLCVKRTAPPNSVIAISNIAMTKSQPLIQKAGLIDTPLADHIQNGKGDDKGENGINRCHAISYIIVWRLFHLISLFRPVGAAGFEPTTPCPPDKCATRLRYAPRGREPLN